MAVDQETEIALQKLLKECRDFIRGDSSGDRLHEAVIMAERMVTSVELNRLYDFLGSAEGRLELATFTEFGESREDCFIEVAEDIVEELKKYSIQ